MDIKEFLEARIAEDEYEAEVCLAQYRRGEGGSSRRWVRQLAECVAKRAIIEANVGDRWTIPVAQREYEYWHSSNSQVEVRHNEHLVRTITTDEYLKEVGATKEPPAVELRALAAIYKDHPDYQQEWTV